MTTEPPKGLKANMKRLYGLITETQFEFCREKTKYKKLLFTLVFFHSILLERKKFQQLGWNVVYSFNDSDFEVLSSETLRMSFCSSRHLFSRMVSQESSHRLRLTLKISDDVRDDGASRLS